MTAKFVKTPEFKKLKGKFWELTEECIYASPQLGYHILVPIGFETDLASVPRFFQRVVPVNDTHVLAAVVHDYLYKIKGFVPGKRRISRKTADKVFLEALVLLKIPRWKRWAMYQAVRMGGWTYWNKKPKSDS